MDTGTPTAAYLQARINVLTANLRSRMLNILSLTEPPNPKTITNIATDQLRMDVESTGLIRAAEEIMVLTRELKDLWLFGGLNTLHNGDKSDQSSLKIEEDAKVVYEFIQTVINGASDQAGQKAMEVDTKTT